MAKAVFFISLIFNLFDFSFILITKMFYHFFLFVVNGVFIPFNFHTALYLGVKLDIQRDTYDSPSLTFNRLL